MIKHSQKFLRRRRFIMILPVLVVPFLTMIFWALGGGQGIPADVNGSDKAGLNLELPNAQFDDDDKEWDKLSLYQQAQRDSIKYNEAKKNDPYFRLQTLKVEQDTDKVNEINSSLGKRSEFLDPNEEKVHKKLEELTQEINRPGNTPLKKENAAIERKTDSNFGSDVDRLESMMELMQNGGQEDAEMQEINGVLNKILDIQHPGRVQQKLKEQSQKNKEKVFAMEKINDDAISFLGNADKVARIDSSFLKNSYPIERTETIGFYGIEEGVGTDESANSVEATVYSTQTLVAGSVVKLNLESDIYINGVLIPKDHFVYGICALNGERLSININSIRYKNSIFPVDLSVYDLDGLEGIYVPGVIARDAAKQATGQSIQQLEFMSLDPSIGAQAAGAGIEAAKGLLSRKSKLVKVTVKAGYRILLKDQK